MLIGSWEKESHFSPDVLEQIAIHYSLEVSKVRYQLQYFCRKAGIKQDRSALWVTAFEKILSKQEAVLKDLGGRIEQFAPLDLHSPSVQLANEIVSAARSCEGQRSGTRGGFPGTRDSRATATADDGPVPIARSKGPGQPISGKVRPSFSHFPHPPWCSKRPHRIENEQRTWGKTAVFSSLRARLLSQRGGTGARTLG